MASASPDLKSQVTDVLTCSICHELFNTPKSLPCLHTFCLRCIEDHCRQAASDHTTDAELSSSCPVCGQNFKIPDSGIQGLVSNFYMVNLMEARKCPNESVVVPVPCEVCLEHGDQDGGSVAASTMYCVDCNQKLCERCSRPHRKMKGGPHNVVSIGNGIEMDLIEGLCDKCDKHKNDDATVYCLDCKINACASCFDEDHRQHKCYYIKALAERCLELIDADVEVVAGRAAGARNVISRLDEETRKFLADAETVSGKIVDRDAELKRLIAKQANELMLEAQALKTEKCKEIESRKENVEMKLKLLETFGAYCSELKVKGKPCDVIRVANDLHTRATELLQNDVTLTDYCVPVAMFKPVNIHELLAGVKNLVGVVNPKDMTAAPVVHTLTESLPTWGVTSLDDLLYVLRRNYGNGNQVEVYNTTSLRTTTRSKSLVRRLMSRSEQNTTTTTTTTPLYSLLRHLSVPKRKFLADVTSCEHHRCLYIADRFIADYCVHRVQLNGKVTKWSVKYEPGCLSVTPQFTIVVTFWLVKQLAEFTTHGEQLRQINLHADVVNPFHAIQLPNGQFVVCHGGTNDPANRVCIVDANGYVTKSNGGPRGSATVGQLDAPVHVAVGQDGFIFVADRENRRVLLLNPNLVLVREIVSRDQLKWKPMRLYLDDGGRLLYVTENDWNAITCRWTVGRVVVVKL